MKNFKFSLDSVLGYKQQVLDELQNEYAILTDRVRRQELKLAQTKEAYRSCNQEFRSAEAEGITIAEALRFENDLRFWEKEVEQNTQQLLAFQQEAEEKRAQMILARQDTASLEKLREKKHTTYLKEVEKSEEIFIEELVAAQRVMSAGA